jgi:pimeloyl-ACP methyl ester carboxylesterase
MVKMNLEQAVLIGNSFGGLIARLFAAQYPQRVPLLVLVNGGVIPDVPGFARVVAKIPVLGYQFYYRLAKSTTSTSYLQDLVSNKDLLTAEFTTRVQKEVKGLARIMRALAASAAPQKRIPQIPVLLLWGEEDSITPRVVGERIQQGIPGSQLSLIAGCRHLPHVEEPEVFYYQVKNFLDALARGRIVRE